eukprot:1176626-Prorocentrum_minimum.AAC.2
METARLRTCRAAPGGGLEGVWRGSKRGSGADLEGGSKGDLEGVWRGGRTSRRSSRARRAYMSR